MTVTNLGEADIELKPHAKPVKMKPYKLVGQPYEFLKMKFEEYERLGLIRKGSSEWATAVMTVPKDSPTDIRRQITSDCIHRQVEG